MAERQGKKLGKCHGCLKGNWFTKKEICIVCNAKYCYNCVLRAMGLMPEGRKCVSCIGQRIDESNRKKLGKCSPLLNQLLSEIEIRQIIMKSERLCQVNQIPPELVYVNCQPLSQQELFLLQNCQNPPREIKPGCFWYDKFSGFWGKEGKKPCQIISPELDVGGYIHKNASDGNTNVLINNREITKAELLMLQFAGVKFEGETHLWVSADGSYQEEGMNFIGGNIWKKSKVEKLVCAILSLPNNPPDSGSRKQVAVDDVNPQKLEQETLHNPLLAGYWKTEWN